MKGDYNFSILNGLAYPRDPNSKIVVDGCVQSLIDNVSDAFSNPTPLPIDHDMVDIGAIVGQTKIVFSIGYSYDDSSWDEDMIKSFSSFSPLLWSFQMELVFYRKWQTKLAIGFAYLLLKT